MKRFRIATGFLFTALVMPCCVSLAADKQRAPAGGTAAIDMDRLAQMEGVAKAWLDFLVRIQHRGALPVSVTVDATTGKVGSFTRVTNDDSAANLGKPFLWAGRIWRDERYLRAAAQLADFFAKAQFPQGGWAHAFDLKPDGSVRPVWQIANFEEWVQSNGLRHLAAVHVLTGDAKHRDAAMRAGELILRAQGPEGWWPWGASVGPEDKRAGYAKGPTLNDWNLNACVGDCLVLYHMTGDRRYLEAIFKAGEWAISAQITGPTPGWAAQYDMTGKPAWARFMEPPAADTMFGTYGAGSLLLMLYDMTGDDRYLKPLRRHLAWLQSIPAKKKGWLWYAYRDWTAAENRGTVSKYTKNLTKRFGGTLPSEKALAGIAIKAGEPIIAYHYQMAPVDHPEATCYLKPLNGHYGSRSAGAEQWVERELAERQRGPVVPSWHKTVPADRRATAQPTATACAKAYNPSSVASVVKELRAWQEGKAVKGLVTVSKGKTTVHVGRGCGRAERLLRQIALAHVALGKAPPSIIPTYRPLRFFGDIAVVDPTRDWYDVKRP